MKVISSADEVSEIEVGQDTVYIRKNIIRDIVENNYVWSYDEEQMTKDEFIARLQEENISQAKIQSDTSATLLELMEIVLLGGI